MSRIFIILSGVFGFAAVALGAFGAHGLRARFESLPDGAKRLEWWTTASSYNLTHALALAFAAWLVSRGAGTPSVLAGWFFTAGMVLFSGSLYAMTLTGETKLGAITPFGGVFLLVGWASIVVAGLRLGSGAE